MTGPMTAPERRAWELEQERVLHVVDALLQGVRTRLSRVICRCPGATIAAAPCHAVLAELAASRASLAAGRYPLPVADDCNGPAQPL